MNRGGGTCHNLARTWHAPDTHLTHKMKKKEEDDSFYPEGIEGQSKAWYLSQVEQYFQEGYTLSQAEILANMLYHQTTGYKYFVPAITFKVEGGIETCLIYN